MLLVYECRMFIYRQTSLYIGQKTILWGWLFFQVGSESQIQVARLSGKHLHLPSSILVLFFVCCFVFSYLCAGDGTRGFYKLGVHYHGAKLSTELGRLTG